MSYFKLVYMGAVLASESAVERIGQLLSIQDLIRQLEIKVIPQSLESNVEVPYQPKVSNGAPLQNYFSRYRPEGTFYNSVGSRNWGRPNLYKGRKKNQRSKIPPVKIANVSKSLEVGHTATKKVTVRTIPHKKYSSLFR